MRASRAIFAAVIALGSTACPPSAGVGSDAGRDASRLDAGAAADAEAGASRDAYDAGADDQIPPTLSEELSGRAKHLVEAIANDNPDLAADILFPRDAYVGARDVSDAGKVWERKVSMPFGKSIHRLAKRQKGIDRAQFVSIELGHAVLEEMPRRHGWKRALWSVKHSRLNYIIDGKPYHAVLAEMLAWHGAWYVVRLSTAP